MPLSIIPVLLLADQITKALIVKTIPLEYPPRVGTSLLDGVIRIIHTRNLGIAFSLGNSLPDFFRTALFILLPLIVVAIVFIYYLRSNELNTLQRWALSGIIAGGLGNLIDRIFRPAGVVDFLDVKFYGIFGMERWPTFNIADASVVVCGILLIISFLFENKGVAHEQES